MNYNWPIFADALSDSEFLKLCTNLVKFAFFDRFGTETNADGSGVEWSIQGTDGTVKTTNTLLP